MPRTVVTSDIRGQLVFLGTGTSIGVPVVGCDCATCTSTDPRNNRLRCSLVLGLPEGTLSGAGIGRVEIGLPAGEAPRFEMTSDLAGIGLQLPQVGWAMSRGATGRFVAEGRLGDVPEVSRIVRANFLSLKGQDFVLAARASGVDNRAIILRHILPNTMAPVIVAATLGIGHAIILEASASFLGLGVQPPTASWGSILNDGYAFIRNTPWMVIAGGVPLILATLGFTFLGEALRDAFDPRLRKDV